MPLGVHLAQVGVGELVEWIVFQLLVEGFDRIVIFAIVPIDAAQIVVGELVVGIDFDLLLERGDGVIVLAHGRNR